MIHSLSSRSFCWISTHSSRGVATGPGCQKILSSSITRRPVTSPSCRASVDLPEPPGPRIKTRFTSHSLEQSTGRRCCAAQIAVHLRVRPLQVLVEFSLLTVGQDLADFLVGSIAVRSQLGQAPFARQA